MIRLPPTGISISQNDVSFHLQQFDIYQGLLKQGFKKEEIIGYFHEQKANEQATRTTSLLPEPRPAPSTLSLCNRTPIGLVSTSTVPLNRGESSEDAAGTSSSGTHSSTDDQSDSILSDDSVTLPCTKYGLASQARYQDMKDRPHAPRQSSLLRFAKGVSSDSPPNEDRNVRVPFSPRSITYRPRSETYSYDQSVVEEGDQEEIEASLKLGDELEHLSLNNELVPSSDRMQTPIRVVPHLRPEAEIFTPLHVQLTAEMNDQVDENSDTNSDNRSFSSSPPGILHHGLDAQGPSPPPLPPMPATPTPRANQDPQTTRRQHLVHQQYLDGSFTVYDDSLPASVQPRTPADLERGQQFNTLNAAYTAPPGMVRSGAQRHTIRQVSGDQSPTARAMLIRERRQREFMRSARIESLRLERTRERVDDGVLIGNGEQRAGRQRGEVANTFWRDDLDADAVGEENFNDRTFAADFRAGVRVVSGNRRVT